MNDLSGGSSSFLLLLVETLKSISCYSALLGISIQQCFPIPADSLPDPTVDSKPKELSEFVVGYPITTIVHHLGFDCSECLISINIWPGNLDADRVTMVRTLSSSLGCEYAGNEFYPSGAEEQHRDRENPIVIRKCAALEGGYC